MSRPERRWWPVAKRLVTLAVFAIPWYLRDGEAVALDQSVMLAQQVMAEKDAAVQREAQDEVEREMVRTLDRIERRLAAASQEEVDRQALESFVTTLREEGWALKKNVLAFTLLQAQVTIEVGPDRATWATAYDKWLNDPNDLGPMPACQQTCMTQIVEEARLVAAGMENSESLMAATSEQTQTLVERYSTARDHLAAAYDQLSSEADADRAEAASEAEGARNLAWIFTAIGGLLLGDWKKLLSGSDAEPSDA